MTLLCHRGHESVRPMWGRMASCEAVGNRRRRCIPRTFSKLDRACPRVTHPRARRGDNRQVAWPRRFPASPSFNHRRRAFLYSSGLSRGQQLSSATALTCDKLSLARPGYGVAYKGVVRNSDYRFSATIPDDLVGLGGHTERAVSRLPEDLELPRAGYYDDVVIMLATPMKEAANGRALLARFLASFQFNHD